MCHLQAEARCSVFASLSARALGFGKFQLTVPYLIRLSLTELAGVTVRLAANSSSGRYFHRQLDPRTCRTSTTSLPTENVLPAPLLQTPF